MSEIRDYLLQLLRVWPEMKMASFMLAHGKVWPIGPQTFAGPRGEPKQCYANATLLAIRDPDLTYVEGKVSMDGLPIDHAWCVDQDGVVVDTTLRPSIEGGTMDRIREYYGVPFRTDYLRKAVVLNGVYGLLDGYSAHRTLPKLVNLGLDEGQRWLLNHKVKRGKLVGGLLMALLALHPHETRAGQDTYYGADGRVIGRETTSPSGSTFYGADGRVETRTAPDGTVYGADGRVLLRKERNR